MGIVDVMNVLVSEGTVLDVVITSVPCRNMTPDEIMTGYDQHELGRISLQDEPVTTTTPCPSCGQPYTTTVTEDDGTREYDDINNAEWGLYFIGAEEIKLPDNYCTHCAQPKPVPTPEPAK